MSRYFESALQKGCVTWFRYQYRDLEKLFFAIPNGGKRNRREAQILKAEGVVAGVSDLFLSVPRNGYHGFYIELKWNKNVTTKEQNLFQAEAGKHGYKTAVIRSFDDFKREIENYLN
jgi:hypothetical protein